MTDKINNVQDLDQIIFFTGEFSNDAASYVANRDYEKTVSGLGRLSYNTSYEIYYSSYPNVKYTEKRTNFQILNDLFDSTLSYLYSRDDMDFSVGYTYAAQNRYHALYTYETDLDNDLDTGKIYMTRDLNDFLIGLNTQTFNKRKFYGPSFEVSSIKVDNTYYNWYPKNSVAYTDIVEVKTTTIELYDCAFNTNSNNVYLADDTSIDESRIGAVNDEVLTVILNTLRTAGVFTTTNEETGETTTATVTNLDELIKFLKGKNIINNDYKFNVKNAKEFSNQINELNLLPTTYYLHAETREIVSTTTKNVPYIIGEETGNYYSYIRNEYIPIENALKDKVTNKINLYEENVCNNDPSIYAYYVDNCNVDIELLLTTYNFGVKYSTFKIGVDSKFNRWFDDTININANLTTNDEIMKISSSKNNEIFSILKNNLERISGDNVEIPNKSISYTFKSVMESTLDDTLNITNPSKIETLDLSPIKTKISSNVNLIKTGWNKNGISLTGLIFDDGNAETVSNIEKIGGINELNTLEYLDISNMGNLKVTPAIDKLTNLKVFKSRNSNIDSFRPAKGISLNFVDLSDSVKSIKLDGNKFEMGEVTVLGEKEMFNGIFNYTPTKNLVSLTLRNVDDELSKNLVFNWYDVLNAENMLDSMIYLELQGITWKDIPIQSMINLRRFDINPNFSGQIDIVGSGNYGWLTRSEYQSITKLYGVNALLDSYVQTGKTFKNLIINKNSKVETFEYSLKVKNLAVEEQNNNTEYVGPLYKDTLNINFNQYHVSGTILTGSQYLNRAANSVLDIINEKVANNESFIFKTGELGNYATCKLDRSIDTSSSVEISKISAGDILLLNGDTLVIFFEDLKDNNIEYVKLGHIDDENVEYRGDDSLSSIRNWFPGEETKIEFIPSEREFVIQQLTLEELSEDKNTIYNNKEDGINVAIDIDSLALEHLDEIKIKDIEFEISKMNSIVVTEVGEENRNGHYRLYNIKAVDGFDFSSLTKVDLTFYCPAEKNETGLVYEIILRKLYTPSYVEDDTLLLNGEMYSIEGDTIIANASFTNLEYDETTETLIID